MGAPQKIFDYMNQRGLMPANRTTSVVCNSTATVEGWPRSLGAAAREETGMLKEAMQYFASLTEPTKWELDDGRLYSNRPMVEVRTDLATTINVQTLTGFVDLYKLRDEIAEPSLIHILAHDKVALIAKKLDEWNRRECFALAALPERCIFRFGQFLDPEEFIIGLQTNFEDGDQAHGDHRKLLKLVSGLTAEAVTIANDDGYSQQVVTKQGMVMKNEEKVSPRVKLAPYRTFREIAQPTSEFVLRLRSQQGRLPQCSLWEADGSEWRNTAIKTIKKFFEAQLPTSDVVA